MTGVGCREGTAWAAVRCVVVLLLFWVSSASKAAAQASNATLTGTVVDTTGGVLSGARVVAVNSETAATRQAKSGSDGVFAMASLSPGRYTVTASLAGFGTVELQGVVLNVDDRVDVRLELPVAARGEAVTVLSEASRKTMSPAVSTVVDRQFVENLPLNGRTFQSLLELTPGVVFARASTGSAEGGQFSVNGQRMNANYFMVDGTSANAGISSSLSGSPGHSATGALPSFTALGTTNGLVSVDALQEFRVQTSTYAPEFGRTPGGQISMITRSGTNVLHGSAFEYFRDDALDATDWFANYRHTAKPKLSQHNFGGVLGGAIQKNRTFFFGSYEGLRLTQPQTGDIVVPSMSARQTAVPSMRAYLNAMPTPNGVDLGNGTARFSASYSDPSRIDATSVRIDHTTGGRFTFFGRVSHSPSYSQVRSGVLSYTTTTHQNSRSYTGGATWIPSNRVVHDLRLNYSKGDAPYRVEPDDFGGAVRPSLEAIFNNGSTPNNSLQSFQVVGLLGWAWGIGTDYDQRQLNIVDSLTFVTQAHEWKVGADFRRIAPRFSGGSTNIETLAASVAGLSSGQLQSYTHLVRTQTPQSAAFDNLSLYVQDNWKLASRLSITYGIRWEFVPPPHSIEGDEPITLDGEDDPYGGQVRVAPRGTPLWDTRTNNFAPRLGATYVVSSKPSRQFLVRGGFGLFHDLGFGQIAQAYRSYPFSVQRSFNNITFPLTGAAVEPLRLGQDPSQTILMLDRQLRLPMTYQWNVTAEQAFGPRQSLTVSYVGAEGRRLLKLDRYNIVLLDWPAQSVAVWINRNRGFSDYRGLQLQFQRRLHAGLQAMASYTFGRSRDTSSSDNATNVPAEKLPPELDFGYSDYDVRHVFTAAATYELPQRNSGPAFLRHALNGWGLDAMLRFRSGLPIAVGVNVPFPPENQTVRPNVAPGQAFWLDDIDVPGGRRLNRNAFSTPPAQTQGDLIRGSVRGFNAKQVDLALRRTVALSQNTKLQLRLEQFNLFNTPNFLDPTGTLTSSQFGVSSNTLARGLGGVSPFYQIGGPRSTQLAVKLLF